MKFKALLAIALSSSILHAAEDALAKWIHSGNVHGNVKYYYINTLKDKNNDGKYDIDAYANSIGGQLSYRTGNWNGFDAGVTLMTTEPFLLPKDENVDTSIIGKDAGAHGLDSTDAISVLGRAYLNYTSDDYQVWVGRQTPKSPLINAKDVRMIPTSVSGAEFRYLFYYGFTLQTGYINEFKSRTSSQFENIVAHALGDNTKAITGKSTGYIVPTSLTWEDRYFIIRAYDYYVSDFINSIYADAKYKRVLNSSINFSVAVQAMSQKSIGNANVNLDKNGSVTDGKKISANMFGAKATIVFDRSKFTVAYTNVLSDETSHDSLVTPWDGTPLYTNTITSNALFQSVYGSGLTSNTAYIGGTQGVKISYTQNYNFIGFKEIGSSLSATMFKNDGFANTQQDINAVLSYNTKVFSFALKGIWIENSSGSSALGTISQTPKLTQYRVIANYKF